MRAVGQWTTDPQKIARKYLSGWFWIDAPASLPLELLDLLPDTNASDFAILRVLRMFRLLRLLKLLKLNAIFDELEDQLGTGMRAVKLLMEVGKMVFLAHLLGCFWFGIGAAAKMSFFGGDEDTPTWFDSYADSDSPTTGDYYLWSIYWALTTLTTVGDGGVTPRHA